MACRECDAYRRASHASLMSRQGYAIGDAQGKERRHWEGLEDSQWQEIKQAAWCSSDMRCGMRRNGNWARNGLVCCSFRLVSSVWSEKKEATTYVIPKYLKQGKTQW